MTWVPSGGTITQVSTESGPGGKKGRVLKGEGREGLREVAESHSKIRTEVI